MNSVFVLSNTKKPLMPCRPARARQLLTAGKAAVYRLHPFTIILKDRADGDVQDVEVKVDPGSKTTGSSMQRLEAKDGGDGVLRTAGRAAPGESASARCLALSNPYAIPSSTRRVARHP